MFALDKSVAIKRTDICMYMMAQRPSPVGEEEEEDEEFLPGWRAVGRTRELLPNKGMSIKHLKLQGWGENQT